MLICKINPTSSYQGHYKIINVSEKSYDSTMFGENVVSYPTPPNGVSSLVDLWNFCEFTVRVNLKIYLNMS